MVQLFWQYLVTKVCEYFTNKNEKIRMLENKIKTYRSNIHTSNVDHHDNYMLCIQCGIITNEFHNVQQCKCGIYLCDNCNYNGCLNCGIAICNDVTCKKCWTTCFDCGRENCDETCGNLHDDDDDDWSESDIFCFECVKKHVENDSYTFTRIQRIQMIDKYFEMDKEIIDKLYEKRLRLLG